MAPLSMARQGQAQAARQGTLSHTDSLEMMKNMGESTILIEGIPRKCSASVLCRARHGGAQTVAHCVESNGRDTILILCLLLAFYPQRV